MRRRPPACAGVACIALLVTGCDSRSDVPASKELRQAAKPAPVDVRGAPVIGCKQRNEPDVIRAGPDPADLRIGPLMLAGANQLGALNASEFYPEPGEQWASHKIGVAVAADAHVTLALAPDIRDRIGLSYARPQSSPPFTVRNGGAAVSFAACPATEPLRSGPGKVGAWTHFGGEVVVRGPGCYPLHAYDADRRDWKSAVLRLGAGSC